MNVRKVFVLFLTVRVVRHWSSLLRDFVDASLLEILKDRLYEVLSSMIQRNLSLPMAGMLDYVFIELLSSPNHSLDLCYGVLCAIL